MNEFDEIRKNYGDLVSKKKFKVWYDKKSGDLKAKAEFVQVNGMDYVLLPVGISNINDILKLFVQFRGMDLRELVATRQISMDDLTKLGYEFDYSNNIIVEKRITMADRIRLAEMEKAALEEKKALEKKKEAVEEKTIIEDISDEIKDEVVETKKEPVAIPFEVKEETDTTTSEKEEIVTTTEDEEKEDGAIDVVVADPVKEEKKEKTKTKKGIKRLKTYGKVALVILTGGVILYHSGVKNFIEKNLLEGNDNKNNEDSVNDSDAYSMTQTNPGEEVIHVSYDNNGESIVDYGESSGKNNYELGSIIENEDMETQIQTINDICFNYQPCSLYNLVVDSDRDAIYAINNMRNSVLTNNCDPETFLNNVVNYLYENGTIFDGKTIKTYDSLNSYARYIVLASSQSILQLCPNYSHTTSSNDYNYSNLTSSFNYMVNEDYRYLTNRGSYGR